MLSSIVQKSTPTCASPKPMNSNRVSSYPPGSAAPDFQDCITPEPVSRSLFIWRVSSSSKTDRCSFTAASSKILAYETETFISGTTKFRQGLSDYNLLPQNTDINHQALNEQSRKRGKFKIEKRILIPVTNIAKRMSMVEMAKPIPDPAPLRSELCT